MLLHLLISEGIWSAAITLLKWSELELKESTSNGEVSVFGIVNVIFSLCLLTWTFLGHSFVSTLVSELYKEGESDSED